VQAASGSIWIKGSLFEQREDVERVAHAVPGVTAITVEEPVLAD